ncbi:peptidoglycan D,D-transpeptidase FtsI family protein [Vallicoccus soli]|uniref:Penicillin-binding protein 2 n=1 Tax=Vallicoccus soli TaxID=2339232 RepID=A0A3A3YTC6_9ACTN|nr:penicillin-binding transpeptidase domain-containing protein [Vallicoccus soli]RJK94724.1 penicillin-binding protein 2 [Vallicoccus soli]
MNRPLRRMGAVVMLLFAVLLVNVNYLQAFRADDLRNRPGNSRTILEEYDRERGPILVDGRAVADSVATDDQLRYLRRYPSGPLFAHATGYYSYVYGAAGVERAENDVLAGNDDRLFVRRLGNLITGEEVQGGAVSLTLDPAAQQAAAEGLDGRKGAVVALDPTTGAILALVSSPTYDPNALSSHDGGAIRGAYEQLTADEDQPLLDRALRETYPPGSTFKLVTAAAALESGRYDPDSEVPGPAELDLPLTDVGLPNSDRAQCTPGSDTTTLTNALRRSCNSSFGAVGLDLGADALREQAQAFGFGQEDRTVPLTTATSAFPEDPDAPQTAQSAIGQFDVRATPLQVAMVAAGIANNGVVMEPYLVDQVQAPDLSVLDRTEPEELSAAVSPEVAAELRAMMVEVVEEGTGTNGQLDGVTVAGKTGTAQQGEGEPPHAWFTSFAPAGPGETARVAVAVVIEDGGGEAEISGNRLAAPIAQDVMAAVLGDGG